MLKKLFLVLITAVIISGAFVACSPQENKVTAADFYKNNAITVIMNGPAGGTTDFEARVFAQFWPRYTDGPTPDVKVMDGGSGYDGLNYVFNYNKNDGLIVGTDQHSSDFIAPKITGVGGIDFDARKMGWVGVFGKTPFVFYQKADSQYKTIADLQKAPKVNVGVTSANNVGHIDGAFATEVLGLKTEFIIGYQATEMGLAAKRGELEAYALAANTGDADVQKGFVKPLFVMQSTKTAWYPTLPAITEVAQLTPDQKQILGIVEAVAGNKSYFMPPGTPADRLEFMRGIFNKMVADPAFIEACKPKFPIWEKPQTAAEVIADLEAAYTMPDSQKKNISDMMKKYTK